MQQSMIVQTNSFGKRQYVQKVGDKSVQLTPIKSKAHVFKNLITAKSARDMALDQNTRVSILRYTL